MINFYPTVNFSLVYTFWYFLRGTETMSGCTITPQLINKYQEGYVNTNKPNMVSVPAQIGPGITQYYYELMHIFYD